MTDVSMGECTQFTDASLASIAGVRVLDISDCSHFTDAGISKLSGVMPLNATGCSQLTDAAFTGLGVLEALHMAGCSCITTDAAFEHLVSLHTQYDWLPTAAHHQRGFYPPG